ncbi:hypothetical protein PMAYCL1PPCAC_08626, partial [Pristionchus mayeri]
SMEAVRKHKTKNRTRVAELTLPILPVKQKDAVQGGPRGDLNSLPDVPTAPGTEPIAPLAEEREKCASPDPEEIHYREEQSSEPTQPPARYIFPRTKQPNEDVAERISVDVLEAKDSEAGSESGHGRMMYPVLEAEEATELEPTAPLESISVTDPIASGYVTPVAYPNLNGQEVRKEEIPSAEWIMMSYKNALYKGSEELVDQFCMEEQNPNGPLAELLQRFKKACEDIQISMSDGTVNSAVLDACLSRMWTMQPRIHNHSGTCEEYQQGSGVGKFEIAVMNAEQLEEISKLLAENRDLTLKKVLCQEVKARSLALQIQWTIVDINKAFFVENEVSSNSPPMLYDEPLDDQPYRRRLRASLSDLFSFLRTPNLPKRCKDAAVVWTTELTSALHKLCLATDGLWLLCHALRMPSPSAEWTAPLIQTFVHSPASRDKLKIDYCIAMLTQLMNPIKARESFLAVTDEKRNDSKERSEGDNDKIISESDLTKLLEQLPIADFYSIAMEHFKEYNPTDNFLSIVAFQLLLMKIYRVGLDTYSRMEYKAFCKQIGMAIRKSVRELACQWKSTRAMLNPYTIQILQQEMDRVTLSAVSYVMENRSLGLWQYLIDLPYDTISPECRLRVEYLLR